MKCGTTTLASQLGSQNGLYMTDPKEPNFFSDDDVFAKGPEWYSALFDTAAPGDVLGEASTHYTKLPTFPKVVERMSAAVPAPRLVYMIRNPVERLVSHFIHEWSQGILPRSASIETAIESHPELIDYGRYGYQIRPFVEAFGAQSILLTSLERFTLQRSLELARIAVHVGYSGPVTWEEETSAENVSAQRVRKLPFQSILVENKIATSLRRSLVPKSFRTWLRTQRMMTERPVLSIELTQRLQKLFAEDAKELASYFADDPSLELVYPFAGLTSTN